MKIEVFVDNEEGYFFSCPLRGEDSICTIDWDIKCPVMSIVKPYYRLPDKCPLKVENVTITLRKETL